jgi:hypothetical protein
MNNENSLKVYIVENKIDSLPMMATVVEKKRGQKMWVICIKLLKTHIEKMSVYRLAIILMKISELQPSYHYVDET